MMARVPQPCEDGVDLESSVAGEFRRQLGGGNYNGGSTSRPYR